MTPITRSHWSTELTPLCEVLAERLRQTGCPHPLAAAVALAVRGRAGVDQATFADDLGLAPTELARIEAGDVPFDRFPDALRGIALTTPGLDLAALGLE